MDHIELIEKRKSKVEELENLINAGKVEQRMLNEIETSTFESIKNEIQDLDKEIEEKRDLNNNKTKIIIKNTNKMENFSLIKSIRNVVEGRNNDDYTLAVLAQGQEDFKKSGLSYRGQLTLPMELRANEVVAGTAILGQEVISEDKFGLLPYLRANSIMVSSGAQLLANLVGNVSIPTLATGSTASWATETAASAVSQLGFGEVTLSPKRLSTYIDISKQFLIQDSIQAEQMLRSDLMSSLIDKLEATLLGTAASSSTQPAGLFYGASYTFSGTTTWANMVSLETAVANNNALKNNASYIIHPTTLGTLKTTSKNATYGSTYIAESNTINGYPYFTTTNLPAGSVANSKLSVFGVMSDFIIGQWGGIDLTVDMYSQAVNGKIRLVVNAYFDGVRRRDASFAYAACY